MVILESGGEVYQKSKGDTLLFLSHSKVQTILYITSFLELDVPLTVGLCVLALISAMTWGN